MTIILKADGVTRRVGGRTIIERASLELRSGETTVVIGSNGAGKSTLLRLLTGEAKPHAGDIFICGERLGEIAPWRLACIRAVLPQNSAVSLPFTVREVASLGLEGVGRPMPALEREAALEQALATADIFDLADRSVLTLSGGELQRTHFARILCQLAAGRTLERRQIVFLDEPVASLDLRHQIDLLDAAAALTANGVAALVVLHDLNLAAAYADNLIVLAGGRIVAAGAPREIMTDALLRDVFRLDLRVGVVPEAAAPFVLPRSSESARKR